MKARSTIGLVLALTLGTSAVVALAASGSPQPAATSTAGPLAGYSTHIVATHYLRGREYETHHYFKPLRDGVLQGLVFRETADGAPMVEVEWAIAPEVWEALPEWQKDFWHPLAPAVDAGRVRLPGLSPEQERETLAGVRGLRAQTLNLAGLDGELPVGLEGVAMVSHLTWAEMRGAVH